jgi:hypothetical protein
MPFWAGFWDGTAPDDEEAIAEGYESGADRAYRRHQADMLNALDDFDHPFHTLWRAGPLSPTYRDREAAGLDGRTGHPKGSSLTAWY